MSEVHIVPAAIVVASAAPWDYVEDSVTADARAAGADGRFVLGVRKEDIGLLQQLFPGVQSFLAGNPGEPPKAYHPWFSPLSLMS